jgi:hypothetical protein
VAGGNTIFSSSSFPISATVSELWIPAGGGAYSVTARANFTPMSPFWPEEEPISVTIPGTQPNGGRVLAGIEVTEIRGQLVVTVEGTGGPNNQADLTIVSDDGQPVPVAYRGGVETQGGTFTFTLPSGSWTVTATLGTDTDSESVTLSQLSQSLTLSP